MMNMKKIASLFLASAMTLSMAAIPAYAEETEAAEMLAINWDDSIEDQLEEAGMTGQDYTFDDVAVQFYLPDVFESVEISEEQEEQGMVNLFATADESAAVGINRIPGKGLDMEQFKEGLAKSEGVSNVEENLINGIDMVTYDNEEMDTVGAVFATDQDEFIEFIFTPASDENFKQVAQLIVLSIRPEEDTAETETE